MSDYIKREDAIEILCLLGQMRKDDNALFGAINRIPAAEVVERKTGRWEITDAYPHNIYCSECHKKFAQTRWEVWEDGSLPRNYCPNCGADMREPPKEEDT